MVVSGRSTYLLMRINSSKGINSNSISSDGRNYTEIASIIISASKIEFTENESILTNNQISIHTRRRALKCYIELSLMYGCEAWTISKYLQKKLETTEMWFLQRMLESHRLQRNQWRQCYEKLT